MHDLPDGCAGSRVNPVIGYNSSDPGGQLKHASSSPGCHRPGDGALARMTYHVTLPPKVGELLARVPWRRDTELHK